MFVSDSKSGEKGEKKLLVKNAEKFDSALLN